MRVIVKPKTEEEILVTVNEKADVSTILEEMAKSADLCIVHLCGCK